MENWITLSKVVPKLIAPSNIVLWFTALALIFIYFRCRRAAISCLIFVLAIVIFASSPITGWLYEKIDHAYPPVPVHMSPKAQVIVVLAGDVSVPIPPRVESQIRGNRALHASRLYKASKAPLILISGGNVFPQQNVESEAHYIKGILIELGVPPNMILVEGRSRNTRENAVATEKILRLEKIDEVLLATSSFHMPRALATFRKMGLKVTPSTASIGAYEVKPGVIRLIDSLPSLDGLGRLERVMHEYLGIAVYCYREWLDCGKLSEELF